MTLKGMRRRRGAKLDRWVRRVLAYQKDHPSASFTEIARHFRVQQSYMSVIFGNAGIKSPVPARTFPVGFYTGVTADQMIEAFKELGSSKLVAERFGLTRSYVNQILSRTGFRTKRRPREVDWQQIQSLYEGGMAILTIARQFRVGHKRVRRELADRGVTIRSGTAHAKATHAKRNELIAQGKKLSSEEEILAGKSVTWQIIVPLLRRNPNLSNDEVQKLAGTKLGREAMRQIRNFCGVPGLSGKGLVKHRQYHSEPS
jgi:hypothetical protein